MKAHKIAAFLAFTALAVAASREVQMYSKKLDYDDKRKKVRLIGDVKITSGEYVMTAPYAEFFTDKKVGEFQGGVKITGEGSTATGKRMKVFYPDQKAVLSGDVKLVTEKAAGAEPGSPTVMTGDQLDYEWAKGYGLARGNVKVTQTNRRAFCDTATYYRDRQMIFMEGNVRVERGDGDWLVSERARMNLATRMVEADGGVTARTVIEQADKKSNQTPQAPSDIQLPPMEPAFPLSIPTAAPAPKLPGVDE